MKRINLKIDENLHRTLRMQCAENCETIQGFVTKMIIKNLNKKEIQMTKYLDADSFYEDSVSGCVQSGRDWEKDFDERYDKDLSWEDWCGDEDGLIWVERNKDGGWTAV